MGRISPFTGNIHFQVKYDAILLRPFKDKILDAEVTATNELGLFCELGPLRIFISRTQLPSDMDGGFDPETKRWVSSDGAVEIYNGCGVRLKIIGVDIQRNEIKAVGSIR